MTDADLQHWRERLAKVSGPTCAFDDLNEWHHDSREIAKRMIAEIDAKQTGWQVASARVVDLEGQLHAMAEQVAVMEGPARNYNRTLARAEQAEARLADYKTAHHQPESEGENDSMLAGYQRALDDVESLKARLAEVERELDRLNSVVLPHARSQENANGFQRGWHAALDRMSGGEAVEVLSRLVPEPAATVEVPVCTACERCSTLSAALEQAGLFLTVDVSV